MSAVHYAPRTPLHLLPGPATLPRDAACVGLIGVFTTPAEAASVTADIERRYGVPVVVRLLTQSGDLEEAARNLFTSLRELDAGDVPVILAAPPGGNEGLALAIADRLRRASR
jgi:L-threonylcarbamoyladenylate synthase